MQRDIVLLHSAHITVPYTSSCRRLDVERTTDGVIMTSHAAALQNSKVMNTHENPSKAADSIRWEEEAKCHRLGVNPTLLNRIICDI